MKSQWKYYQVVTSDTQQKNWADCIKHIATVKTYPELHHTLDMTLVAGIENFHDLNFFRHGVQPMWEDPANKNGGRIIMEIPLSHKDILHTLWSKTTIFCALDAFSTITGCVYAEKANYRICLWIGDSNFAEDVTGAWKHVLECNVATFAYSSHDKNNDSSRKGRRPLPRNKDKN